jgi:N-acetylneuraminic acid mutarotase
MNGLHRFRTVTLATLATFTALTSLGAREARADWTVNAPLPTARAQTSIAVDTQGRIHVLGGYAGPSNSSPASNAHDIFAADAGWTTGPSLPIQVRAAAAVGVGDKIYMFGGYADSVSLVSGGYATAPDGGWAPLPAPTYGIGWETAADVGADGKLYVFGGEGPEVVDGGSSLGATNSKTQIFDPTTSTWALGADMPGRRMQHRALRGSDGKFYIIGGEDQATQSQSTVFVYNPTTNTWADGPRIYSADPDGGLDAGDAGPIRINSFAAAATPDRAFFVVAGGSTAYSNQASPYFNAVFLFDVAKQTWSRYALPLPLGRRELVAAFVGCSLSVIGGTTGTTSALHDGNSTLPLGPDSDGDGSSDACDVDDDNDGTPDTADCKPQNANVHPGATEICNGIDDNCSGAADEGLDCSDAGVSDAGSSLDSGTVGVPDSGNGGTDGGPDNAADGDSSSGCSCDAVGVNGSTGLETIGLGVIALAVARVRRRRSRG